MDVTGKRGWAKEVALLMGQFLSKKGTPKTRLFRVNRYRPHQGKEEVARRRKQIAAGMLRVR